MTKKIVSVALIAVLTMALFLPSASAISTMFVYTENGRSLNVRSAPVVGDNQIGSLAYGAEVHVESFLNNGWCAIVWGSWGTAYVQSRYLQWYQPGPKPTPKPAKKTTAAPAKNALADMNAELKTAKRFEVPFAVVVRPARASGWVTMYWAPTTESEVAYTYSADEQLLAIAETTNWYQVQDQDTGATGFIRKNLAVTAK